jgi:hypothetical protein
MKWQYFILGIILLMIPLIPFALKTTEADLLLNPDVKYGWKTLTTSSLYITTPYYIKCHWLQGNLLKRCDVEVQVTNNGSITNLNKNTFKIISKAFNASNITIQTSNTYTNYTEVYKINATTSLINITRKNFTNWSSTGNSINIPKGLMAVKFNFTMPRDSKGLFNITIGTNIIDPEVTDCAIIDSSGYYYLKNNLSDLTGDPCFDIQADDVIFDGRGHSIKPYDDQKGKAIAISFGDAGHRNITIENITIFDYGPAIYGVAANDWENISILNNIITSSDDSDIDGYGLELRATSTSDLLIVENNTILHYNNPIYLSGFITSSSTKSILFNNNSIIGGGTNPIFYAENDINATFTNNKFYKNTGYEAWLLSFNSPDNYAKLTFSNNEFHYGAYGAIRLMGKVSNLNLNNNLFNKTTIDSRAIFCDTSDAACTGNNADIRSNYEVGLDGGEFNLNEFYNVTFYNNSIKGNLVLNYYYNNISNNNFSYGGISANQISYSTIKNNVLDNGLLFLQVASYLNISNNKIRSLDNSVNCLAISYGSQNNVSNNNVSCEGTSDYGLWLAALHDSYFYNNNIKVNNTGSNAVYLQLSYNNSFFNDIYDSTQDSDIYVYSGSSGYENFTNCTFNKSDTKFYPTSGGVAPTAWLNIMWYVDTHVMNSTSDINSATINITDKNGNSIYNGYTNTTGWIPQQTILEYSQNVSTILNYTPHWFNVSKTGYPDNNTQYNIDQSKTILIILGISDTCTAPLSGDWTLNCNDNCTWGSIVQIPANVLIFGSGILYLNWNFTSTNQYIELNDTNCELDINSSGGIYT